jgi:hypothetical protein
MVMECVGHHRKRPNPSDTDYYEPRQNTPEDNHDACSLPHVLEFTVAMRRFEELSRTAPWRRLLASPVSEIAHEEPNALSCQSGLSTRAEALPDDADMRWRRAKRTAAMGGFAIQFGPCFGDQRDDQGGATAWQQGYGRPALQPQSVASAKILVGVALITPDSRSRTE